MINLMKKKKEKKVPQNNSSVKHKIDKALEKFNDIYNEYQECINKKEQVVCDGGPTERKIGKVGD